MKIAGPRPAVHAELRSRRVDPHGRAECLDLARRVVHIEERAVRAHHVGLSQVGGSHHRVVAGPQQVAEQVSRRGVPHAHAARGMVVLGHPELAVGVHGQAAGREHAFGVEFPDRRPAAIPSDLSQQLPRRIKDLHLHRRAAVADVDAALAVDRDSGGRREAGRQRLQAAVGRIESQHGRAARDQQPAVALGGQTPRGRYGNLPDFCSRLPIEPHDLAVAAERHVERVADDREPLGIDVERRLGRPGAVLRFRQHPASDLQHPLAEREIHRPAVLRAPQDDARNAGVARFLLVPIFEAVLQGEHVLAVGGHRLVDDPDVEHLVLAPELLRMGLVAKLRVDRDQSVSRFAEVPNQVHLPAVAGGTDRRAMVAAPAAPSVVGLPRRRAGVVDAGHELLADAAMGEELHRVLARGQRPAVVVQTVPRDVDRARDDRQRANEVARGVEDRGARLPGFGVRGGHGDRQGRGQRGRRSRLLGRGELAGRREFQPAPVRRRLVVEPRAADDVVERHDLLRAGRISPQPLHGERQRVARLGRRAGHAQQLPRQPCLHRVAPAIRIFPKHDRRIAADEHGGAVVVHAAFEPDARLVPLGKLPQRQVYDPRVFRERLILLRAERRGLDRIGQRRVGREPHLDRVPIPAGLGLHGGSVSVDQRRVVQHLRRQVQRLAVVHRRQRGGEAVGQRRIVDRLDAAAAIPLLQVAVERHRAGRGHGHQAVVPADALSRRFAAAPHQPGCHSNRDRRRAPPVAGKDAARGLVHSSTGSHGCYPWISVTALLVFCPAPGGGLLPDQHAVRFLPIADFQHLVPPPTAGRVTPMYLPGGGQEIAQARRIGGGVQQPPGDRIFQDVATEAEMTSRFRREPAASRGPRGFAARSP